MSPAGRRTGSGETRAAILEAAAASFAERGYAGTTMRGVAAEAGVDAALIHHYFGTKQELFRAVLELPVDLQAVASRVLAGDREELGERLASAFLSVWDDPAASRPLLAQLRSALTDPVAAESLRGFVIDTVLATVTEAIDRPRSDLRATLAASQLIGVAILRHALELEPLASADRDELAAALGPTLQRYLTGPLDAAGADG